MKICLSIIVPSLLLGAIPATAAATSKTLRGHGSEERELQTLPPYPYLASFLPLNTDGNLFGLSSYTEPVHDCLASLIGSQFNLQDIDNYDKWYTEDSYVHVAETGVYKGINSIKEYMSFGGLKGPYFDVNFDTFTAPDGTTKQSRIPVVLKAEDRRCELAFISTFVFDLDNPDHSVLSDGVITKGGNIKVTTLGTYTYTHSEDLFSIEIDNLRAYYPQGFWDSMAYKWQTSDFENYLCNSMKKKCTDTWDFNGFTNQGIATCKTQVSGLPRVDTVGLGWKAKSVGCRGIHLSFVVQGNDAHCAHISYDPLADGNGYIKCQDDEDDSITAADVMTPQELGLVSAVGPLILGQHPDGYTCSGDCL